MTRFASSRLRENFLFILQIQQHVHDIFFQTSMSVPPTRARTAPCALTESTRTRAAVLRGETARTANRVSTHAFYNPIASLFFLIHFFT